MPQQHRKACSRHTECQWQDGAGIPCSQLSGSPKLGQDFASDWPFELSFLRSPEDEPSLREESLVPSMALEATNIQGQKHDFQHNGVHSTGGFFDKKNGGTITPISNRKIQHASRLLVVQEC